MQTLVVNGSPRERTHTAMIKALEKGLTDAGSTVTKISLKSLNISPCLGCYTCWRTTPGRCVQEDDMESLLPLVAQSDLLFLVTPVYVDGMTAQMKTFMDRLIPFLEGIVETRDGYIRHPLREGVKRGKIALMSACGFPELDTFDPLVAHVRAMCKNFDREYAGEVLVPSGGHLMMRGDWDAVLKIVESAGAHLVKDGKIPGNLSLKIHSLVSSDELVNALNAIYG